MALPGQTRGGHYHRRAHEWFTVVQGAASVSLRYMETGEEMEFNFTAFEPVTLYIPPGIAHTFRNSRNSSEPMILVAYSDQQYDPTDTILYAIPQMP